MMRGLKNLIGGGGGGVPRPLIESSTSGDPELIYWENFHRYILYGVRDNEIVTTDFVKLLWGVVVTKIHSFNLSFR